MKLKTHGHGGVRAIKHIFPRTELDFTACPNEKHGRLFKV